MNDRPSFPLQIETDRLRIAIYEKGDGAAFFRILQENAAYLEEEMFEVEALKSVQDAETYVEEMIASWHSAKRFVPKIVDKATGEMIGQLWLEPRGDEKVLEVGYFILEKKQGQGLVSEAVKKVIEILFAELHAESLEIHTKEANARSIRLAERCGFRFSHRVKDGSQTKAGQPVDMLHFQLKRALK